MEWCVIVRTGQHSQGTRQGVDAWRTNDPGIRTQHTPGRNSSPAGNRGGLTILTMRNSVLPSNRRSSQRILIPDTDLQQQRGQKVQPCGRNGTIPEQFSIQETVREWTNPPLQACPLLPLRRERVSTKTRRIQRERELRTENRSSFSISTSKWHIVLHCREEENGNALKKDPA